MKQMLTDIAKAIVNDPDSVSVSEKVSGDVCILELTVAKDDMGRVIGKQGRIAKEIRTVMRSVANRSNQKIMVEID